MFDQLTGHLLIASSLQTDPVLAKSVCLLVHQDDEKIVGVLLNRPMRTDVGVAVHAAGDPATPLNESRFSESTTKDEFGRPDQSNMDAEFASPSTEDFGSDQEPGEQSADPGGSPIPVALGNLHFGGPISGPVVAVHDSSELAEAQTGPGIYVAAQRKHLEELLLQTGDSCRIIIGHLGWQSHRLLSEIQGGLWHALPATPEHVFRPDDELWPRLIRRATAGTVAAWVGTQDDAMAAELN